MDTQTMEIIALCACIIGGIIFCFFGNRWLKVIVAIYGFAVGFLVARIILSNLTNLSGVEVLLASAGGGVVGALLFVFLLYFGIFLIGFGGGVLLSLLVIDAFNLNIFEWYVYVPVIIVGSILGSLTLNLRRIFISIFTSFIGASALALAIYQLSVGGSLKILEFFSDMNTMHSIYSSTIYLVSLAVLFIIGLIVQLTLTSKNKSQNLK